MMRKVTNSILLIILAYIFYRGVFHNQPSFDIAYWQDIYNHSQYCVPECEFRGNIDDPELYTLAGVRYIEGSDPSTINSEIQPLTKYLFGLSTHISGTPHLLLTHPPYIGHSV
jgi:hypothetical protein